MKVRNILFIMADQLRADYLSCYGHPNLETTAVDWLASRGVRFSRAYVQAPVCGPSRMSFYTGRYVTSHGSTYNGVPLRVGEMTLGDHLRALNVRAAVVGKTHMTPDYAGLSRLGVDPSSFEGVLSAECGFEPFERDDGLWPSESEPENLAYNKWLHSRGYSEANPWQDAANSALRDGKLLSGWRMRHAREAANIKEEHSETAYMTDRAMEFIEKADSSPWCLHLSYIKPHWPYIAPAPYNQIYGEADVIAANRSSSEFRNPHPVYAAYMRHEESVNFAREEVRRTVIPTYMGLIKQIDDHLGRLWRFMAKKKLFENTLVVFTSDHGDYLGDHWLGEKELFHEESVRVPLILYDPDPEADSTRGTIDERLVEAIDLAPTFVEAVGGGATDHILEGTSLLASSRRTNSRWRDAVISECDYSFRAARLDLNIPPSHARAYMVRDDRWKYIHYDGFRPQLFDLVNDPHELNDLGEKSGCEEVRLRLHARLSSWSLHRRTRVTMSEEEVVRKTNTHKKRGYCYGVW